MSDQTTPRDLDAKVEELVALGLHKMRPTLSDEECRKEASAAIAEVKTASGNENLSHVLYWLESSAVSVIREPADAPDSFHDGWAYIDGNGDGDGPSTLPEALQISASAIAARACAPLVSALNDALDESADPLDARSGLQMLRGRIIAVLADHEHRDATRAAGETTR